MESARCADSTVVSCSVACVVALLGSLEDLSQGRGLSDEHIEFLSKMKETDSWEALKEQYDNAASAREMGNSVNGRVNGEGGGYRRGNRWEINSQGSPDGDIESLTKRFEKDGGAWDSLTDGEFRHDGKPAYMSIGSTGLFFLSFFFSLLHYRDIEEILEKNVIFTATIAEDSLQN